jgi:hypothetical protein
MGRHKLEPRGIAIVVAGGWKRTSAQPGAGAGTKSGTRPSAESRTGTGAGTFRQLRASVVQCSGLHQRHAGQRQHH